MGVAFASFGTIAWPSVAMASASFALRPFQDFSAGFPSATRPSSRRSRLSVESTLVLTCQRARIFCRDLKKNPIVIPHEQLRGKTCKLNSRLVERWEVLGD